jgi:putative membrane protein
MKSMTTILASLLLSVFGLTVVSCTTDKAATPETNQPAASPIAASSNPDQEFINNAAKGNRAEIDLGRMMSEKATDRGVKQFAQQMVKDHGEALAQLQQLAQTKNITLPDGLPADAEDLKQKLSAERGKQTDKDYVSGMVEDHQKDVKEFQDAAQSAHDPDIKQWASNLVPKLQEHLQKAQALDSKINKSK